MGDIALFGQTLKGQSQLTNDHFICRFVGSAHSLSALEATSFCIAVNYKPAD